MSMSHETYIFSFTLLLVFIISTSVLDKVNNVSALILLTLLNAILHKNGQARRKKIIICTLYLII